MSWSSRSVVEPANGLRGEANLAINFSRGKKLTKSMYSLVVTRGFFTYSCIGSAPSLDIIMENKIFFPKSNVCTMGYKFSFLENAIFDLHNTEG